MSVSRHGGLYLAGSLILSLALMLLPLPLAMEPFKPYWPALVLIYWALESTDRVGLGLAFTVGLIADLISGVLLGEQALRLTALVFIVLRVRPRLRFFRIWQQTLAVGALLFNDRLILLVVRLFAGQSLPPVWWWGSPLVGAALWPFLFLLLDDLRSRQRIQ